MSELESPPQDHILYSCPRCHQEAGRSYRVMDDGPVLLRVLIRCQGCQHRWSALVERAARK